MTSSSALHGHTLGLRISSFWGHEDRLQVSLLSPVSQTLKVQTVLQQPRWAFFVWLKGFFYKPVTLFNDATGRSVRVLLNVGDAVKKLGELGLSKDRIKLAIEQDRLGQLILDAKVDAICELLPNACTKEQAHEALEFVNQHGHELVGPTQASETNPIVITKTDGQITLNIDHYELRLDDTSLRVNQLALHTLGYSQIQIKRIDEFFRHQMQKMRGHFISSNQPIVYDVHSLNTNKAELLPPFYPRKVTIISPKEILFDTGQKLGHGSFKEVKKVINVFNGKLLAHYFFDKNIHEKESRVVQTCIQEVDVLKKFRQIKGFVRLKASSERLISPAQGIMRVDVFTKLYNRGSLHEALKSLTNPQKMMIAKQIAHALGLMHRQKMVHRDLKPENIFLKDTPSSGIKAVIGDLGASCKETDLVERSLACTTHVYSSPEYAQALIHHSETDLIESNGMELDVWSLGVIFYEMFFNKRPPWMLGENPLFRIAEVHFPISFPQEHPINPILRFMLCDKTQRQSMDWVNAQLESL